MGVFDYYQYELIAPGSIGADDATATSAKTHSV
jgi:hypothetical protein